jgi:hypothetical protein
MSIKKGVSRRLILGPATQETQEREGGEWKDSHKWRVVA